MEIRCNNCGELVEGKIHTRTCGELEISYLECEHCMSEFTIIVTDKILRRMIAKEQETAAEINELIKKHNEELRSEHMMKKKKRRIKAFIKEHRKLTGCYTDIKAKIEEYEKKLKEQSGL